MILRQSVTVNAPAHGQVRYLVNTTHGLDGAMACLAFDSMEDMRRVVKMHKIRQHVNLLPNNGRAAGVMLLNLLNVFVAGVHLDVTVHAYIEAWNRGVAGSDGIGVAI